jgi:hypothetical protein
MEGSYGCARSSEPLTLPELTGEWVCLKTNCLQRTKAHRARTLTQSTSGQSMASHSGYCVRSLDPLVRAYRESRFHGIQRQMAEVGFREGARAWLVTCNVSSLVHTPQSGTDPSSCCRSLASSPSKPKPLHQAITPRPNQVRCQ